MSLLLSSPLFCHCFGYSGKCLASGLCCPRIRPRQYFPVLIVCIPHSTADREAMIVFCCADNLCWFQLGKTGQPKARCFPHGMPVLIRLNNLIWLSVAVRHNAYWILYGYPLAMGKGKVHEENTGFLLPEVFLLFWKPSCPGHCKVGTWGMSDDQIPLAHLCVCVCVSAVTKEQSPFSSGRTSPCICHSGCPPLHSWMS